MIDYLLIIGTWALLLGCYGRAFQQGLLAGPSARLIWALFFCVGLTFVFRTGSIEQHLDRWAGGLPLGYWAKAFFILVATGLYGRVLRQVQPAQYARWGWVTQGLPIALLANLLLLYLGWIERLDPVQVRYSIMTLTDAVVMLNMLALFLPINYAMLQYETLEPMQIKHIATLIFCLFYVAAGCITLVLGPVAVFTGYISPLHEAIPLGIIIFFCVVIQLLPHRYLHQLLLVERVWVYRRLRRLENVVMQLSGRTSQLPAYVNLLHEPALAQATYMALIAILDYSGIAAETSPEGRMLYTQISQASPLDASYEVLVRALARIQV